MAVFNAGFKANGNYSFKLPKRQQKYVKITTDMVQSLQWFDYQQSIKLGVIAMVFELRMHISSLQDFSNFALG